MSEVQKTEGSLQGIVVKPIVGSPTVTGPLPDTHPTYEKIGKVAAEMAHLEHALDTTIWSLIGLSSEIGGCFTSQMIGPHKRLSTLKNLVGMLGLSERIVKNINALSEPISTASEKRNRYVHDAWYVKGKDQGQFRVPTSTGKPFGFVPVDDNTVNNDLNDMRKVRLKVEALKRECLAELKSLREKSSI